MFEELGISFGTALIVLLALYFIIKWAVKNGITKTPHSQNPIFIVYSSFTNFDFLNSPNLN